MSTFIYQNADSSLGYLRKKSSGSAVRLRGFESSIIEMTISEAWNEVRDFANWDFHMMPHRVAAGGGVFEAIRGDYGCGKTFLARRLQDRAQRKGLATAEVQISETETPLHRLETVYGRLMERLSTSDCEFPNGILQ